MTERRKAIGRLHVEDRHLVRPLLGGAALQGSQWDGVTLKTTIACVSPYPALAVTARIHAFPDGGDAGLTRYAVELQDPGSTSWIPACRDEGGRPSLATPFAGVWDQTGTFRSSTSDFTFACAGSPIGKCDALGYRHFLSTVTDGDLARRTLHLACTRMMRADYCGDGIPHTHNGTLVDVWDSSGVVDPEMTTYHLSENLVFEAGWTPGGKICMHHLRWFDRTPPCFQGPSETADCRSADDVQRLSGKPFILFNTSALN
jgi:ADYC domain